MTFANSNSFDPGELPHKVGPQLIFDTQITHVDLYISKILNVSTEKMQNLRRKKSYLAQREFKHDVQVYDLQTSLQLGKQ